MRETGAEDEAVSRAERDGKHRRRTLDQVLVHQNLVRLVRRDLNVAIARRALEVKHLRKLALVEEVLSEVRVSTGQLCTEGLIDVPP